MKVEPPRKLSRTTEFGYKSRLVHTHTLCALCNENESAVFFSLSLVVQTVVVVLLAQFWTVNYSGRSANSYDQFHEFCESNCLRDRIILVVFCFVFFFRSVRAIFLFSAAVASLTQLHHFLYQPIH